MKNGILKVMIFGSNGRMGQELINVADEFKNTVEILKIDRENVTQTDDFLKQSDIVIDFSSPTGFEFLLNKLLSAPLPLISGTTGLQNNHFELLDKLSLKTAVLHASNFSLGINLLIYIANLCGKVLDNSYEPEIIEIHHKNKKDAPSGTALSIAESVLKARNLKETSMITSSRYTSNEARTSDELGIQSIRGGDVVGEHTLMFLGPGERLELSHKASERAIFARGAWKAAKWIVNKNAGRYSMKEVLNVPSEK